MGLIAIREDEDKAASVGVNTPIYKVLAYIASAVWIGAAGGVYAYYLSFIDPRNMFDIVYSVFVVLAVAARRARERSGAPCSARSSSSRSTRSRTTTSPAGSARRSGTPTQRLIFFGALLALVVLLLPRGIIPSVQEIVARRRESETAAEVGARFERKPLRRRRAARAGGARRRLPGRCSRSGGSRSASAG